MANQIDESEKAVVQEVKAVLITAGLIHEGLPPSQMQRINTGAFKTGTRFIRSANKGTLDFEGYDKRGRFVGIECKRPHGGRLSAEQKARIDDINLKGGVAGVVRSGAEALELLQKNNCI